MRIKIPYSEISEWRKGTPLFIKTKSGNEIHLIVDKILNKHKNGDLTIKVQMLKHYYKN